MSDWLISNFQSSPGTGTDNIPLFEYTFGRILMLGIKMHWVQNRGIVSITGKTDFKTEKVKVISSEGHQENECILDREDVSSCIPGKLSMSDQYKKHFKEKACVVSYSS